MAPHSAWSHGTIVVVPFEFALQLSCSVRLPSAHNSAHIQMNGVLQCRHLRSRAGHFSLRSCVPIARRACVQVMQQSCVAWELKPCMAAELVAAVAGHWHRGRLTSLRRCMPNASMMAKPCISVEMPSSLSASPLVWILPEVPATCTRQTETLTPVCLPRLHALQRASRYRVIWLAGGCGLCKL